MRYCNKHKMELQDSLWCPMCLSDEEYRMTTQSNPEEPTQVNSEKDNPCWECEYRKNGERDYINICLLDEIFSCMR